MGRIPQNQHPKTRETNIWSFEKIIKVLKSLSRARKREDSNKKEGPQLSLTEIQTMKISVPPTEVITNSRVMVALTA